MPGWLRRLRARIRYRHFDRDLASEIEAHRELKAGEHRARGLDPAASRSAASRDLGNVTLMREDARGVWIAPWLQSVWQDLRYAAASFRRQPLFTLAALLVLSLGTVLVTVGFSLAHATFLRPWQVPDPASVVLLRTTPATSLASDYRAISIAEFRHLREHARSADVFYTMRSYTEDLAEGERNLGRASTIYVSDNYLTALRVPMRAGRGFRAIENDYQSPVLVGILADRLWRDAFNRDPSVVGRTIRVGVRPVTIVGVAAASSFTDNAGSVYDLAMPLTASMRTVTTEELAAFTDPRRASPVGTIGARLVANTSAANAAAELTMHSRQFRAGAALPAVNVTARGTSRIAGGGGGDAWDVARLVLLALGLVLVLACANVGNMLLARGLSRRREMGIRLALGAGRARLVRQLLTEAGVLSIAATAVGLAIAAAAPRLLARFVTIEGFERPEFYAPTLPVFWFSVALAGLTTVVCGLAPALRATGATAAAAMDRHGHAVSGVRLRRLLLSAQIAGATVLLVGAGLLTRATSHALTIDPGFAINELQVISFELPRTADMARRRVFLRGLESASASAGLPVAVVNELPLTDSRFSMFVRHRPESPAQVFRLHGVSMSFFDVTGVTIVAGRAAAPGASPREIVVSSAAAQRLWPSGSPLGRTLLSGLNTDVLETVVVVGVATDAAINSLAEFAPVIYHAPDYAVGHLLTREAPDAIVARVGTLAAALEPAVVVSSRPLREQARESLQIAVIGSWLAWSIGGLGLLLATVGAIGVFAYAVEERRREIGIRLALGARPAQVVRLVLRTSQAAALIGVTAGLLLSIAAAPLLRAYLYGLSPFDFWSYLQIAAILLAAAAIATFAPARRAVRINPVETLRVD
jgi:macrolide transport system ATP-binding/permease protein